MGPQSTHTKIFKTYILFIFKIVNLIKHKNLNSQEYILILAHLIFSPFELISNKRQCNQSNNNENNKKAKFSFSNLVSNGKEIFMFDYALFEVCLSKLST